MKHCNLLLIAAALPLLNACVAYQEPYYSGAPAYYGDAYPSATYIEYNQSYGHRGGYRENYWAHDRAREAAVRNRYDHDDRRNDYRDNNNDHHGNNRPGGWRR